MNSPEQMNNEPIEISPYDSENEEESDCDSLFGSPKRRVDFKPPSSLEDMTKNLPSEAEIRGFDFRSLFDKLHLESTKKFPRIYAANMVRIEGSKFGKVSRDLFSDR